MPSISILLAGWVASELVGKTLSVTVDEIDETGGIIGLEGPRSSVTFVVGFSSKGFRTYVKVSAVVHRGDIKVTFFAFLASEISVAAGRLEPVGRVVLAFVSPSISTPLT